tara:strand:+ start:19731 stop:20534 length:804 start_codon:yes stop_codon:yes gene_type:complete
MGNSKFWYYPEPNGTRLEIIDLGEQLGEFFTDFEMDAKDGIGYDGGIKRTVGAIREIITIQRDRLILAETVAQKFRALQSHLDRGYSCSFSADSDKCFSGFLRVEPASGDTTIYVSGNPFFASTNNNAIATGDYLNIVTPNPGSINECVKIETNNVTSHVLGGNLIVEDGVSFSYETISFCHYYRYYPVLKRPAADIGKNIITNEHGQLWNLDLRLVVDYQTLFSWAPDYSGYQGSQLTAPDYGELEYSGTEEGGKNIDNEERFWWL